MGFKKIVRTEEEWAKILAERKERRRLYMREYAKREDVKERQKLHVKKYESRPEIAEKMKAWRKEYYKQPENMERQRQHARRHYYRKKKEKELENAVIQEGNEQS